MKNFALSLILVLAPLCNLKAQGIPFPGGGLVHAQAGGGSCGNSYLHCRQLIIDRTKVSSTQTSFPVLLSATEADWAVTGSGGDVQNTVTQSGGLGITIPADFILADSTCTTPIAGWEFESYGTTTGAVVLHFIVASLSSSVDTTSIWVCTDKAAVNTQQMTTTATWDSSFTNVYHLSDNAANTTVVESTSNGATGTNSANTSGFSVAGEVAKALNYAGLTDNTAVATSSFGAGTTTWTICAWVAPINSGTYDFLYTNGGAANLGLVVYSDMKLHAFSGGLTPPAGTTVLTAGTFYYACLASSGGVSLNLYLNGVLEDTSGTATYNLTNAGSFLGNYTTPAFNTGKLDEFRLSNVQRAVGWILTEYNSMSSPGSFITIGARQ